MKGKPNRMAARVDPWLARTPRAPAPEPDQRPVSRSRRSAAIAALSWLTISVFGCAHDLPSATPALNLKNFRMVDMSWGYGPETLFWPTASQRFDLRTVAYGTSEGGYFYSAYDFCAPEHGGTHLDAPRHFSEHGWTADEIPLDRLFTPAVVIDVTQQTALDRDYRLTEQDVERWERTHGRIPSGSTVYLRTGWGVRWPDALLYLGDDTPGDASNLHFPSYGLKATRLLLERGVVALGVDTASIDFGPSKDFPVHRLANGANILGLENVAGLEELPARGAWTLALPMKIENGSGAPARILGLVPRTRE